MTIAVHFTRWEGSNAQVMCGIPLADARARSGTTQNQGRVTCARCKARLQRTLLVMLAAGLPEGPGRDLSGILLRNATDPT